MVAAISATPSSTTHPNPKPSSRQEEATSRRPPLLPSERDNGLTSRRPKSKEITSRYMSSSTSYSSSSSSSSSSRRCASPLTSPSPSTTTTTPLPKRAQSVERTRRPVTPRPITPLPDSRPNNGSQVSAASKLLFTSTRSLSVSFQGESFSLPISKTKAVPPPNSSNVRKGGTPERRRTTPLRGKVDGGGGGGGGGGGDQMENSKPIDHHRWPGRTRQANPLTRSVDFTSEKKKVFGSGAAVQSLQQSMIDDSRRASFDGRLRPNLGNAELCKSVQLAVDPSPANGSVAPCDLTASDTESVSSGSNSGSQDYGGMGKGRGGPRGISVPARFWQETNSRLRRLQDPGSPLSSASSLLRTSTQPKLVPSKKLSLDSPVSSPRNVSMNRAVSSPIRRAMSSPIRGPGRPASPSKIMPTPASSPSRGMISPARMRNGASMPMNNQLSNTPSILSFSADVRRGKVGETRAGDAHLLRLLYNRHLQWRFVNARTDAALMVQKITAEKNLYNAWVTTSELRDSVTVKRIKLHLRRQNLKLTSILKGQMTYLEEWSLMDRDHSSSLSGAIEALKASTLRLPIVGGARADIQNVKDAVSSAVDVMQAMASSICYLLSKVEQVNSLVAELANVTSQERALLDQCKDLLSTLAAMQVTDCSLRTHILQLKRVPETSLTAAV